MKLLLAQIDTKVAALEGNTRRIVETLDHARRRQADLVVFPELTVTGYPPKDLLFRPTFAEENLERLEECAAATKGLAAVIGYVEPHYGSAGKGLYNAAALCVDGRIASRHYKSLIPTYDVFDEGRYFDSAPDRRVGEAPGSRLGVTICEDCWNDRLYWTKRLYHFDPVEQLIEQKVDLLVNISASPYSLGKTRMRHEMFAAVARRHRRALVHVNLVGGNDSLLFDGASAVFNREGEALAVARQFEEELLEFDLGAVEVADPRPLIASEMEELRQALVMGLRDYTLKCGFRQAIVGLSGGIDSALTATLAVQALGAENVYGVSMPSRYSSDHSRDDAAQLAENLGIDYRVIPIEPAFDSFLEMLGPSFEGREPDVTEENLQARVRGVTLMALSNKFGAILLTTGNKSELAVGYATLYGDMCGGLAVISDVPKTMVYELARWINRDGEVIPANSIEKPPSAELRPDQLDTDSLPAYDVLDPILRAFIEERGDFREIMKSQNVSSDLVHKITRMVDRNEYKRQQAAPCLRVTTKAFGYGRRMPIAAYD